MNLNQPFKRDPNSGAIVFEKSTIEIRLDLIESRLDLIEKILARLDQTNKETLHGTSSNPD